MSRIRSQIEWYFHTVQDDAIKKKERTWIDMHRYEKKSQVTASIFKNSSNVVFKNSSNVGHIVMYIMTLLC